MDGKAKGGLDLMTRAAMLKGGDRGAAVNVDAPEKSLLLEMISYKDEDHQMPPKGKLEAADIEKITDWVKRGAPMEETGEAAGGGHSTEAQVSLFEKGKTHWAYQRVKDQPVPQVADAEWRANPVDAFIYDKLQAKGLKPAPPASRAALIRRTTFDLIGLPPTPEEIAAFVADTSPDAYKNLIERLLASPHYGEKWGRHWLDVIRYAETNGFERDNPKPHIWRFRDYVINAFNNDKPYDQFVREQLAGDELPNAGSEQIIATGFYRLSIWDDEPADKDQGRFDTFDSILDTTGQAFLGMTVGCARCHDHKIDPLPAADYYSMLSFMRGVTDMDTTKITTVLAGSPEERAAYEKQAAARQSKIELLKLSIGKKESDFLIKWKEIHAGSEGAEAKSIQDVPALIAETGAEIMGEEDFGKYNKLRDELNKLNTEPIPGEQATCVAEKGPVPPDTFILIRGNPAVQGDKVEPRFPQILDPRVPEIPAPGEGARTSGRRRVLAEWIASPENPLTARVMVNRIWQHHFGRGIVRSPNNYGLMGDAPTHPELLDWLAAEFVRQGWSIKAMHRIIMTSRAYQMSSQANEVALSADPANDLFWRFDMRRLGAEEIRDSILAMSGKLNLKTGGPSVFPELPPEVLATSSKPNDVWGVSPEEEQNRRSVYIHLKRSLLVPILQDFDLADTDSSCPVRFSTTQPTQALNMINSAFLHEEAAHMAERLRAEAANDPTAQVNRAWNLVTGRPARETETARALQFLEEMQREEKLSAEKALERFCLLALNLNEFVFVE